MGLVPKLFIPKHGCHRKTLVRTSLSPLLLLNGLTFLFKPRTAGPTVATTLQKGSGILKKTPALHFAIFREATAPSYQFTALMQPRCVQAARPSAFAPVHLNFEGPLALSRYSQAIALCLSTHLVNPFLPMAFNCDPPPTLRTSGMAQTQLL